MAHNYDKEDGQALIDSGEYAPVKLFRLKNAQCTLLLIEGC